MTTRRFNSLVLVLVLSVAGSLPASAAGAAPRVSPPQSNAHGKSLAQWMGAYWAWYYTGADASASIVDGVQLLPLPAGEQQSGSWTPADPAVLSGHLDVTQSPGTPFLLPEFAWVGERYAASTGLPDDVPIADDVFLKSIHINLTIDGRPVITDANLAAFYVGQTAFDPIVNYPEPSSYGSIAALWFQGIGFLSAPLSVGKHEIRLYESFIVQPGEAASFPNGIGLIYDNSWTITVAPH